MDIPWDKMKTLSQADLAGFSALVRGIESADVTVSELPAASTVVFSYAEACSYAFPANELGLVLPEKAAIPEARREPLFGPSLSVGTQNTPWDRRTRDELDLLRKEARKGVVQRRHGLGTDLTTVYNVSRRALVDLEVDRVGKNRAGNLYYQIYARSLKILLYWEILGSPSNAFAESLRDVYRAGGRPCGWIGDYPDGGVVVYWPHDSMPTFKSGN